MCPHMSTEIGLLRERPATKLTAKRTLSTVRPQVHRQNIIVGESAATHQTDEPAPGVVGTGIMAAHVLVEVAALSKGAVTMCADVRALASVKADVSLEVTALRKAAVTRAADKWAFTRMNAFMSLQV